MSRNRAARHTPRPQFSAAPAPQQAAAPAKPEQQKNPYGVVTEHQKTIDGHLYTTTLYPAGEGFDHLLFFAEAMAGPLAVVVNGAASLFSDEKITSDISTADIGDGLLDLVAAIKANGGSGKVRELLKYTLVRQPSGATVRVSEDFEVWSQGRYPHMLKVVGWVIEVNLVPFGGVGGSNWMSRLMEVVQRLKPSSTEPPQD